MTALYRERLSPGPLVHLISLVAGGGAGLLGALWGPQAAAVAGVVVAAAVSALLVLTSPVVEVLPEGDPADGGDPRDRRLRAGGAVIPVTALGAPEVLDAEGLRRHLGVEADARTHVCHRSWIPAAVRLEVVDPRDATPAWLVCTRRPAELLERMGLSQAAHSEQIS